ncbi:MAG: hypothetical protein NTY75_00815 [Candidatus Shapirobacteria bacterium]|nr:hypothetical protein [Candidatus Shapirobacteria bacterium]
MSETKVKSWGDLLDPTAIDQAVNSLGRVNFFNYATNPSVVIGKIKHLREIGFYDTATAAAQILRVRKLSDKLK